MTKENTTTGGGAKGKGRGSKGKARKVTPEQEAQIRARVDADAKAAHPLAMEAYTQTFGLYLNNAEALKIAVRVSELYAAEVNKPGDGHGWRLIVEASDHVMSFARPCLNPNPDHRFFVPIFVDAVREIGRGHESYVDLKALLARVDAGEDLDAIAAQDDERRRESGGRRKAKELAKREPKDKTSDAWRYWKLRRIEAGMRGDDPEAKAEAWREFWRFFEAFKDTLMGRGKDFTNADARDARSVLANLIITWQQAQK